MGAVAQTEATGLLELEKAFNHVADRQARIEREVRKLSERQEVVEAFLQRSGDRAVSSTDTLVTVTKEDAMYGAAGAALGSAAVYVAAAQGLIAATPLNYTIGAVSGLATGVTFNRFRK